MYSETPLKGEGGRASVASVVRVTGAGTLDSCRGFAVRRQVGSIGLINASHKVTPEGYRERGALGEEEKNSVSMIILKKLGWVWVGLGGGGWCGGGFGGGGGGGVGLVGVGGGFGWISEGDNPAGTVFKKILDASRVKWVGRGACLKGREGSPLLGSRELRKRNIARKKAGRRIGEEAAGKGKFRVGRGVNREGSREPGLHHPKPAASVVGIQRVDGKENLINQP